MAEIEIKIPIVPKAQKRARSRISGTAGRQFVQVYTDKDQRNEQENFKAMLYRQLPHGFQPIQGQVRIYIKAFMPIPKCSAKKYLEYAGCAIPHVKTPDVDNLAKHVKDCRKGAVWLDDKQVTMLMISKSYAPDPGWEIRLEW